MTTFTFDVSVGIPGPEGWTPTLAVVADGSAREVLQVINWTGGEGTKPEIGMYCGPDGFVTDIAQASNVKGNPGAKGDDGDAGTNGWSPIFAVVTDGARRVLQVSDWAGGSGNKPTSGQYLGPTGFTGDIAQAVDVRGTPGAAGGAGSNGWTPVFAIAIDGERRVQQVIDWVGGTGAKPTTGQYVGLSGFTNDIAQAVDIRGPTLSQLSNAEIFAGTATAGKSISAAQARYASKLWGKGVLEGLSSVCMLGDSITALANTNPPTTITTSPQSYGTFSNSIVGWCNELMDAAGGVGFDIIATYAVGGAGIQAVIDTQLPLALADTSRGALVHVGVNNFGTLTEIDSIYTMISKMRVLVTALSNAKDYVVVDSIDPCNPAASSPATPVLRSYEFKAANAAIAALCNEFPNVIFNDMYQALLDPSSLTRAALPNTLNAVDGIHNLTNGAYILGYAMFANVNPRLKLTRYKTKGANLLPTWAGTGGTVTPRSGTVTGTPPVGYNCWVVTGAANVTISQVTPDRIRLTITNAGAASLVGVYLTTAAYTALTGQLAVGDTIQGAFSFMQRGAVLLTRLACAVRYNFSSLGTNAPFVAAMTQSTTNEPTVTYPQIASGGTRKTPPMVIPSGMVSVDFFITVQVGASTGAIVLDIYNPEIYKLT